jgi:hypothetical protein
MGVMGGHSGFDSRMYRNAPIAHKRIDTVYSVLPLRRNNRRGLGLGIFILTTGGTDHETIILHFPCTDFLFSVIFCLRPKEVRGTNAVLPCDRGYRQ